MISLKDMIGVPYRRGWSLVVPSQGSIPKVAPVSLVTWVGGSLFGGLLLLFRPSDSPPRQRIFDAVTLYSQCTVPLEAKIYHVLDCWVVRCHLRHV